MNAKAYELGKIDGGTMAWEAEEQGQRIKPGSARNFDESLINAVGGEQAAKLFGVALDSEAWQEACSSYETGAVQAWDAAAEEYRATERINAVKAADMGAELP